MPGKSINCVKNIFGISCATFAARSSRSGPAARLRTAPSPQPTGEVYSALDRGLIDIADRGDARAKYEERIQEVAR